MTHYTATEELPDRVADELSSMLLDGETFNEAFDCRDAVRPKARTHLILTDSRLLTIKFTFLSGSTQSFRFSQLSGIKTFRGGQDVTLRGSGIETEFKLKGADTGKRFARSLRERVSARGEG
ncbi:hypothetical protein J2752_000458 [Halarchaeum rubridurum]|uniref:PH domain-containing protein n=1 Tax=Halarchaeum rubridurum TaxID=489911 RepID=A0A830FUY9_9EURY|nr:hypothetical protein [Halarchaeum rubridurum]MBP1953577.1 hypothetical protein [Halarchaeum rubridurum]GGM64237.1 hypothetical protein GCM10009017_12850 [Halarchaeum rubridurum]